MKNIYLLFSVFLISHAYSANKKTTYDDPNVTIEILNIVTNGLILPNNTFSFNGVDDLQIEFDVKTTYNGNNVNYLQGNTSAYFFEPNSFDNEPAEYYNNGVLPLYLFKNFINLQVNGNEHSFTFRKKINLKRNTAYNTGCSIVFYYSTDRTDSFPSTRLTKLTYSIIGGTKTANQPYIAHTANLSLNNISYSNGLPLINNEIVIPTSDQESDGEEIGTRSVDLSFNFNAIHGSSFVSGYYPNMKVQIIGTDGTGRTIGRDIHGWFSPTDTHGSFTAKNIIIKASDVVSNSFLRIILQFQGMSISYNCGLVKLSRPIQYNNIYNSQIIQSGQTIQPFTSSQPTIWTSGGTCPYRGCNDPRIYTNINNYQWQIKQNSTVWTDIPNAISKDYSPLNPLTSNTSFRRIAFYNGLYSISNPIDIIIAPPIVNTICCNQNIPDNGQPQPITGNTATGNYTYQWQIAPFQYTPMQWSNIAGATNQNYTHIFTQPARRGTIITTFRRLLIQNGSTISISNEITINRGATARYSNTSANKSNNFSNNNLFTVYPNPVSNILNIELENKSTELEKIHVYDLAGREFFLNKTLNNNIIQVDVSTLFPGTYYIKYEFEGNFITKKLIKE